jgi:glycosyltransferase involved in cell wall biosynthesis
MLLFVINMKINLIFFLPNFIKGGAANSIVKLCKGLDKSKYIIYLVSLNKNDYKNEIKNNKNIKLITLNISRVIFSIFKLRSLVKNVLKNSLFKTIFISNMHYANIISILALCKLPNLKLIVTERTSIEELRIYKNFYEYIKKKILIFLISKLYKYSDKIVSNSKFVANDLRKITNNDITTIYPPSIKFVYNNKPKKISSVFQIIYVGRLSEEKGVDLIIKALSNFEKKNFILKIIGEGPQMKYLKNLTTKLILNKNVKFLGYKKNTNKFYKNSNLFINASYFEGMPNAIIEAINFSVPLICSNAKGGTLEVLRNGRIGDLFESGNDNDLYKKILNHFNNPKLLIKKVSKYRAFLKNYTQIENLKNYKSLFEKI